MITVSSANDDINIAPNKKTLWIGTGQDLNVSVGGVSRINSLDTTFTMYDTGKRYGSVNVFGSNPSPDFPKPALFARNGLLTDIIYGFMNMPTSGGGDGAGLNCG